jgi:C4-dicarboxylate transporter, DctQ subunit
MHNFLIRVYTIVKRINEVMLLVSNYMLALLTLAVALDVVMRYVFNSPITGVKQFAEYTLVWLCFLSVGWVLIEKKHVAITYLEQAVCSTSKLRERRFSVFINVMCLCYTLPLLWLSGKSVWFEFWAGTVESGEAGAFPTFLAYLCIPVGFLSLSVILILNTAMRIMRIEEQHNVSREWEVDLKP